MIKKDEMVAALEAKEKRIEELEKKYRWIPVNLGPPYDNRPKKSGEILVLTKKKEIFQVHITVGEDEFEQGDGTSIMCPTHSCFLPTYGNVLLGEDDCITHYRYITLPGE
ncbi:hypothetical protein LCGC14_2811340 [marine sediment metagenome]|uniref:Uncharacterized protein n=1 Tax=marine sediment metagenome TaxID=412755 RepID=A0A0F8Z6K1_9ZZZZ